MMLAMQQQNLAHHDGHHVPAVSSPLVTFSPTSQSTLSTHSSHLRPSRPKLTLNTAVNPTHFRSVGKSSSLRLDTLSAVSPTVRNTFSNAYEQNSGAPTARPKLSIDPSVGDAEDFRESPDRNSSRTPSNSSISSTSTTPSLSEHSSKGFYQLPKDIPSILINSHLPRTDRVRMSNESRRPLEMVKRVSFRDPLDEEIKTQTYILAHSDIDSTESEMKADSSDSSESTPTATSPSLSTKFTNDRNSSVDFQVPSTAMGNVYSSPPPRKSRRAISRNLPRRKSSPRTTTRMKRDSSSDEDSDDSYTQTPIAGRCKRRREWTWTLDQHSNSKEVDSGNEKHDASAGSYDDDSMSISSRCTGSSTN